LVRQRSLVRIQLSAPLIMKKFDLEQIKEFIRQQKPSTRIYLGVDSERVRSNNKWYADYHIAVVAHIEGKHGCKVFGQIVRERDYDKHKNKPTMRLMQEVYKAGEIFLALEDVLRDRQVEIHLDINPSEKFGSNHVVSQALGYIKSTCNLQARIKPQAFAATGAANRLKHILK
jgi:predicted RNase H-related nuclease YkuK (DUF458 family)